MCEFVIDRTARNHHGRTAEQIETFSRNAEAALRRFVQDKRWQITIRSGFHEGSMAVGHGAGEQLKALTGLMNFVRDYPNVYDAEVSVADVLSVFNESSS